MSEKTSKNELVSFYSSRAGSQASFLIAIIFGTVTWLALDFQVINLLGFLANATNPNIIESLVHNLFQIPNGKAVIVILFQIPLSVFLGLAVYVWKRFERYSLLADAVSGECFKGISLKARMTIGSYDPRINSWLRKHIFQHLKLTLFAISVFSFLLLSLLIQNILIAIISSVIIVILPFFEMQSLGQPTDLIVILGKFVVNKEKGEVTEMVVYSTSQTKSFTIKNVELIEEKRKTLLKFIKTMKNVPKYSYDLQPPITLDPAQRREIKISFKGDFYKIYYLQVSAKVKDFETGKESDNVKYRSAGVLFSNSNCEFSSAWEFMIGT
jgi:hypothetical protein